MCHCAEKEVFKMNHEMGFIQFSMTRDVQDRVFAGYRIPDTYRIVPGRIPDSRIPDSRIVVSMHQAFMPNWCLLPMARNAKLILMTTINECNYWQK